jgi:hypothetical protein
LIVTIGFSLRTARREDHTTEFPVIINTAQPSTVKSRFHPVNITILI